MIIRRKCSLDGRCEGNQLANKDPQFWKEKAAYILRAIKIADGRDYSISATHPLVLMKDGEVLSEDEIKSILDENNRDVRDDYNQPVPGFFGINEFQAINRTEVIRANLAAVIAVAITETGGFLPKEASKPFYSGPTIESSLSVRSRIANDLFSLRFRGITSNIPDRQKEVMGLNYSPFYPSPAVLEKINYISNVDSLLITERVYGGMYLAPSEQGRVDLLSSDGRSSDGRSLNYQLFRHHNIDPLWYKRANSIYLALQQEATKNPGLGVIFKNIVDPQLDVQS